MIKKKIQYLLSIILIFWLFSKTFADYWIYYWTDQKYASKIMWNYDVIIIQPYNFNLFKDYKWKKICYLTVWEFDWTKEELNSLWLSWAIVWYNSEWDSFIMNISDISWQSYLIKKENSLKAMWCNWIFLDTIWQDWQETWAISIIKKLKNNWKSWYFVANNAHYIKNQILSYIDAFMFEWFYKDSIKIWSNDDKWLKKISSEYATIHKSTGKPIYALSYAKNNKNKQQIKSKAKFYWFEIIFADYNLTKIY